MKRIISVLLILLLLSAAGCSQRRSPDSYPESAAVDPVPLDFAVPEIDSYEGFAYTLSAALLDGSGNRNFSPVSMYFALAMAAEGANGQTLADLLKLLGCPDLDTLHDRTGGMLARLSRTADTGEIKLCNSLWISDAFPLRKTYQTALRERYQADAETVRFGAEAAKARISQWIREKTNGLIDPAPDAMAFDETTLAVLVNTIYFCDQWSQPFWGARQPGTFTDHDGTKKDVDFLHRLSTDTYIFRGDGFLRYSVRFESRGYMTFVLPDEGVALETLLGSPEKLQTLLESGEQINADVDLLLPPFSVRDRFDLADVLCSLGLTDAFTVSADFSGMSDRQPRLDRVLQETAIEPNELGVEAAAYTEVAVAPGDPAGNFAEPSPRPLIEFHLDRPFLFVLYAGTTPLFVGTVTSPDA